MALTSITKDFVVKSGALTEGTSFVSSSTGQTGTLQVNGGVAIAKNLIVGTTATIWGATTLNNNLTVTGQSTLQALIATNITGTTLTLTSNEIVGGNASVAGLFTATGATYLGNTLTVAGNSQFNGTVNTVAGALFVTGTNITALGGTLSVAGVASITNATLATTGGLGAVTVAGGQYVAGNLVVMSTTASTGTTASNALYVNGGIGVNGSGLFGGPVTFRDTVTFNGTATYVLSTNTFYTDNILEIHTPPGGVGTPWTVDDGKDIGLRFHYFNAGADQNAAIVLDNTTKELHWYATGAESAGGDFSSATFGTFRTGAVRLVGGTVNSGNTSTGDLTVLGGVGIGGATYVGGNVSASSLTGRNLTTASGILLSDASGNIVNSSVTYNYVTNRLVGTIDYANTATNIAGGVAGSLVYQTAQSQTTSLPIGTNGQLLYVAGGMPTWVSPTGLTAGSATTSSNIAGGLANQIPFQNAPGNTVFGVGLTYNGTAFTTTNIQVTSNNNATASTGASGALMVTGGVGISRDLWVGGNINIAGNINFDGAGADTLTATTGTFVNVFITGTNATTSAITGALQIAGGVGIGGGLFVAGTVTAPLFVGTATSVQSTQQTANATYYPTLVDNNNLTASGEVLYTTSSFSINPSTGAVTLARTLAVGGTLGVTGATTLAGLTAGASTLASVAVTAGATVGTSLSVGTTFTATGYTSLNGGAVISAATVTNTLGVTGYTSLNGGAVISAATVTNSLVVTGYSQLGLLSATQATLTNAVITNNASVGGAFTATGFSSLNGGATISAATITNTLVVNGYQTVNGGSTISALTVTNALSALASVTVGTTLNVSGVSTLNALNATNGTFSGTLGVTGSSTFANVTATNFTATNANIIGNETVGGVLSVTGRTTLNDVIVNTTITATNLVVTGTANLPSNISLSALTVTNLTVTNNQTIGNNLSVTNLFTATGAAVFGSTSVHAGIATFNSTQDSNAINNGSIVTLGGVGIAKNLVVGLAATIGSVSTQTVVNAVYSNNSLYSSYTSGYIVSPVLTNLDTFSASGYRTAKYIIQVVDGTKVHVEEVLVFHDGTNVYMTEYGISTSQGELGTFDAVLSAGTVTLNFTANYTPVNMTIKVVRTAITA